MKTFTVLLITGVFYLTAGTFTAKAFGKRVITDTTFVNASGKTDSFGWQLKRQVELYLDRRAVQDGIIDFNGIIDTAGHITKLKAEYVASDYPAQQSVMRAITSIPPLHPATANGKPIRQQIHVQIQFRSGGFWLNYYLIDPSTSKIR